MSETGKAMKVLILDDDELTDELASFLFSTSGYDVAVATSADRAVQMALEHPPHIAFINIDLPEGSGISTADTIRAHYPTERTWLVALCTTGESQQAMLQRRLTFDFHLTNPISLEKMVQLAELRRRDGGCDKQAATAA